MIFFTEANTFESFVCGYFALNFFANEFVINNERSSFLTFSSNSFFISVKDRTGCLSINLTICHPNCD